MAKASKYEDVTTDHNYDGIEEFDNPLPAWWLWTFGLATIFGVVYWIGYHSLPAKGTFEVHAEEMAEYNAKMAEQSVSEEDLNAAAADPAEVAAGREVFVANCKACHNDKGEGNIGPNLTDAYWIHGQAPKEIWTTITMGVAAKGMPQWGPSLGQAKIRQVYAYLHSIKDTNVAGKAPQGVDASGKAP